MLNMPHLICLPLRMYYVENPGALQFLLYNLMEGMSWRCKAITSGNLNGIAKSSSRPHLFTGHPGSHRICYS